MTVKELIDALNLIQDDTAEVIFDDGGTFYDVEKVLVDTYGWVILSGQKLF